MPCAYACVGGVCIVLAPLCAPTKKSTIFQSSCAHQYPTVTATSHRGSSACFDGDIGHVIIDASLVRRCFAMRGRGCRRQRIDIQQNKSTHGCNVLASTDDFRRNTSTRRRNAPASTASPDEPITPPLARGHLLIDGQHPKQAHCS